MASTDVMPRMTKVCEPTMNLAFVTLTSSLWKNVVSVSICKTITASTVWSSRLFAARCPGPQCFPIVGCRQAGRVRAFGVVLRGGFFGRGVCRWGLLHGAAGQKECHWGLVHGAAGHNESHWGSLHGAAGHMECHWGLLHGAAIHNESQVGLLHVAAGHNETHGGSLHGAAMPYERLPG